MSGNIGSPFMKRLLKYMAIALGSAVYAAGFQFFMYPNAIVSGDYPIVLITTLIIAAAMLICSFMVDVFNALLDPRVRLGE